MRISDWSSDACSSDLKADLEKANSERDVRPWIIVGGHRPIYSVDNCDQTGIPSGTAAAIQAAVEGLFHDYKVDQFWDGHKHAYERHWPRSEEHTSELQSLMRISYAVFCLKKQQTQKIHHTSHN